MAGRSERRNDPRRKPGETGRIYRGPRGTEADVDAAYEAAEAAQSDWAATPREERNEIVQNLLDELNAHVEEITGLLATEAGTPGYRAMGEFATTTGDVEMALELEPPEEEVRPSPSVEGKDNHIVYEPVGVVGVISPWNFPLHLTMRAVAPAIALGNTVVLKPATDTPITGGLLIAKLCEAAGVPDGVLNVVTGRGSDIGDRIAGHPTPRVVSFTGSTAVGKGVAEQAGASLALPALELGGNAPFIVTDEADLEKAARAGAFGSFFHQGRSVSRSTAIWSTRTSTTSTSTCWSSTPNRSPSAIPRRTTTSRSAPSRTKPSATTWSTSSRARSRRVPPSRRAARPTACSSSRRSSRTVPTTCRRRVTSTSAPSHP